MDTLDLASMINQEEFDKQTEQIKEEQMNSVNTTMASDYAKQINKPLNWDDFNSILAGEGNPQTAKFKLTYMSEWVAKTNRMWSKYDFHKEGYVYVCPELTTLWPLVKKETNQNKAIDIINEYIHGNVVLARPGVKPPVDKVVAVNTNMIPDGRWFCTTLKGVNLRPGIMGHTEGTGHDSDKTEPLHLDDMNPHGLIAGRTGAGKSVALNAMIASLMTEFAPWELNINLADFKIVEMSRYGQVGFEAPHVSKIAATEAMEYVVSVMYDMYESMSIRQSLFAAVGVQNIKDFRNKFGVVLPHVVLLVDEFQQMYELANPKQTNIINALIKMVTKLGRATGYHLLFASQSMSGTLSADVQSNFKMRICLPAAEDVSTAVLGNKASSTLKGKGYCFTNCEGGALEANIKYRIPFLQSETDNPEDLTELQKILKWNKDLAEEMGYCRPMNFFRDSAIRPLHTMMNSDVRSFEEDIELFRQSTLREIEKDKELEDILLLGDSYVYKQPKGKNMDVTLEYFKLKIGDRKNIICIGDTPYDRVYMTELLAMQYAMRGERNDNVVVQTDAVMQEIFDINSVLTSCGSRKSRDISHKDFIANFQKDYSTRQIVNEFAQYVMACEKRNLEANEVFITELDMDKKLLDLIIAVKFPEEGYIEMDPDNITNTRVKTKDFADKYYHNIINNTLPERYTELTSVEVDDVRAQVGSDAPDDIYLKRKNEMLEVKNIIREDTLTIITSIFNAIKSMYVSGVKDGKFSFKNMKTITYWIVGYNGVSSIAGERSQSGKIEPLMRNCTNYGIRCIFIGGAVRDISDLTKNFGYVFIKSSIEANYMKFDMDMSKEFKDNIMRFKSVGEVINNVKQHLYPIPTDEKSVKVFDTDYVEFGVEDFFSNF